MNTEEVNGQMDGFPGFCGVFACNQLPVIHPYMSFIVNTDPLPKSGEHWVAVYITEKCFYFFDSFGRTIEQFSDPFRNYMREASKDFNIRISSKNVQFVFSTTCAHWCIYWLYCKFSNYKSIFGIFSNNRESNEVILCGIMEYILEILPKYLLETLLELIY